MQRPCFALAVLLGSMASSVLVVRTVNAQSPAIAAIELPGPVDTCGGVAEASAISVVLGQSVDTEDDGWSDEIGGADHVASDDGQQRDDDSSLATCESNDWSTDRWWTCLRTGYDEAYDFAIFHSHRLGMAPSQTEIDYTTAVEELDPEMTAETDLTAGSTDLPSCEDYDDCLATDWDAPTQPRSSTWTGREWTEVDETAVSSDPCGPEVCEPILLPEACAVWLWHGIQELQGWTENQLQECWAIAQDQRWVDHLYEQLSQSHAEPSFDDLFGDVRQNAASPPNVAAGFDEEVLLIATADSLDRLSLRLQDVAQYLRLWAADRIVMKVDQRRVAQKPAH